MLMTLCKARQAVESVSPFAFEAVDVDICWHEFSHYERLFLVSRVVLLPYCELDVGCFGALLTGGYKWQYILIATLYGCV